MRWILTFLVVSAAQGYGETRKDRVEHRFKLQCGGIYKRASRKAVFSGRVPAVAWTDEIQLCATKDEPYGGARSPSDLCDIAYRMRKMHSDPVAVVQAKIVSKRQSGVCQGRRGRPRRR